ncbi:hypothetical protein ZEAMMB73_Zm00001d025325 [Zea mays]|uniref:Desiccation-related protein PCC13-62 n=1 Tax=Zea mays TaxID=4577 RepID=A0A1D6J6I1_MAIZE|nr:hypothetical protein ZEAMMB73_Zm00001d025325 [Zea mays]
MGAPAPSVAVVAAVVVCLCGAFARAQDMDNEWARPPYRGFFGGPGSLLPQSDVDLLEAIKQTVRGFPRPLLDISAANFGKIIEQALNATLDPPFNPYENSVNFLVASYIIPYVGLTGYVGANPRLFTPQARKLLAGLLAVESAQDAVIRTLLYERGMARVAGYAVGVAEVTAHISDLRNSLGRRGVKDEGLVVAAELGPEGLTVGNVIAGDHLSLAYDRTPEEILGIVYGTGNPAQHGGFFPQGADGRIARGLLA